MENFDRKNHWEKVYQTNDPNQVSWYQPVPKTSLDLIMRANLAKHAKIIDIGGGDGFLVDHLLALGYTDITVLDISGSAINRAKSRLGDKALLVNWVICDAAEFKPNRQYDLWHDRAAFHFFTESERIAGYVSLVKKSVAKGGHLILGTFSQNGPKKCSGLNITRYNESSMNQLFSKSFEKTLCLTEDHPTPFATTQNFLFCSFKRK